MVTKGISYNVKNSPMQRIFWDRFVEVAEDRTGFKQHERGFMRAIKIALDLPADSVPQRWFEGGLPRLPYLLRMWERWHVTPNYLLGIEEDTPRRPRAKKLAKGLGGNGNKRKKA